MAAEIFDGNTLRRVQNMLKAGRTGILRDSQAAGLAIRVYKSSASWSLITRDAKWTIAPINLFSGEDIPTLRSLVAEARQLIKDGRDPEKLFEAFRSEKDVKLAAHRTDVSHGVGKTWEEIRDSYLEWVSINREKDTARGYRSALGAAKGSALELDFAPLAGRPIASIETGDLAEVRNNIVERGKGQKIRQANLTVSAFKACFKWYANTKGSLLKKSPATDLSSALEKEIKKKTETFEAERTFNQDEIGMLIYGLETVVNPAARLSIMIQLFTGQRRLTPLEAYKTDFIKHEEYGMVWRLDDKTNAWRVLPLPQIAMQSVEAAIALSRSDNKYLFPQQRPNKKGEMDSHMNERTVSAVLEKMRTEGGVLADIPFVPSTHDLRRAFVTVMSPKIPQYEIDGVRLRKKDIQIITHVDEGRDTTASAVYDKNSYLDTKYKILEEWQLWCMEGYYRVKASREWLTNARSPLKAS